MPSILRPDPGVMVADDLLSDRDLAGLRQLFTRAETLPQALGSSSGSRTRNRAEVFSMQAADLLWSKLQPLLGEPPEWFARDRRPRLEPDIREWHFDGCNEFTRFYEYAPGDEFRSHRDGSWRAGPFRRTLLTVLVYLPTDAPATGGETIVEGIPISPDPGRIAVFDHRLIHAGSPVESGSKLVLRNDVLASATAPTHT